jgi:hypothetical protein
VRPAQDQIEPVEPVGVHASPLTRNRARLATPVPSGKARGGRGCWRELAQHVRIAKRTKQMARGVFYGPAKRHEPSRDITNLKVKNRSVFYAAVARDGRTRL